MKEIYSLKDLREMTDKDMDLIERIESSIDKGKYWSARNLLSEGEKRGIISEAYYNDVIERINGYK